MEQIIEQRRPPRRNANAPPRSSRTADLEINLTATDPIDRIKEFCNQGNYIFHYNWDKFKTGVMCELEITYQLGDKRVGLTKEVRYIQTDDVRHAQRIVSAILLERIGLAVEESIPVSQESISDLFEENRNKLEQLFHADAADGNSELQNFALTALGNLMGKVNDMMEEEQSTSESPVLLESNNYSSQSILTASPIFEPSSNEKPIVKVIKPEGRTKSWADIVSESRVKSPEPPLEKNPGIYDATGKIIPGTATGISTTQRISASRPSKRFSEDDRVRWSAE